MNTMVLDDVPVKIDMNIIRQNLHIQFDDDRFEDLEEIAAQACIVAKPKAVYREAYVDNIGADSVLIGGVRFASRVMSLNLEKLGRVFACVVTCGAEIDEWTNSLKDVMDKFMANSIMDHLLNNTGEYLASHLSSIYELGKIGWMSPGSLPDWPVTEQTQLFSLLGNVEQSIGVRLTNSCMLLPVKSASGIVFPSDISYVNCMLCRKPDCGSRRTSFNEQLYKEKLG
jgi:hypothetical protein